MSVDADGDADADMDAEGSRIVLPLLRSRAELNMRIKDKYINY